MSNQEITAEVELNYPAGKKTIEMLLKKSREIEACEEGKVIMLNLINGEHVTGVFKGMADDDVKIQSLGGEHTLGYKVYWVTNYFEEIKKEEK